MNCVIYKIYYDYHYDIYPLYYTGMEKSSTNLFHKSTNFHTATTSTKDKPVCLYGIRYTELLCMCQQQRKIGKGQNLIENYTRILLKTSALCINQLGDYL